MAGFDLWFKDDPDRFYHPDISTSTLLYQEYVTGISGDGKTVVGYAFFDSVGLAGYRWTMTGRSSGSRAEGVTEILPAPGLGRRFTPVDVSGDGRILAGNSSTQSGNSGVDYPGAFRWTRESGYQSLGVLPGYLATAARAISDDGQVVAGDALGPYTSAPNERRKTQALIWSESQGLRGLGFLPGTGYSQTVDISADGLVVVGNAWAEDGITHPFRWTQGTGMLSVEQWLAGNGIALPEGTVLLAVTAVSADGSVLAGNLKDYTDGWVVRVQPHRSGVLLDVGAYQRSLIDANRRLTLGLSGLANATLSGAHHRSLLDNGLVDESDRSCAWVQAEAADYDESRTRIEQAEVGVCTDLGPARLGLGLGKAKARQEWDLGSRSKSEGEYLLGEAAFKLGEQWQASVLGYHGRFDVDSQRRYYNGTAVHASAARPDAKVSAWRARLDWNDAAQWGGVSVSPYLSYTWNKTELDAYREDGGGFPSRFERSDWTTRDARLGTAFSGRIGERNELTVSLEAVRRLDKTVSGVRGEIIDLFGFDLPGGEVDRNWGQALVDFDHRFGNGSVLGVGARAASSGGDADWGVSVGYRMAF